MTHSKLVQVDKTAYLKKWRKENPNYYKNYYKKNKKHLKDNLNRYRESVKGKATIKRYEQTEKRKAGKRAYQKLLRDAKKQLDSLRRRGKI